MRKVLIIDDNKINRQILRAMLEKDYELLEAASGEAALETFRQNAKDISAVLLDIVMPGIDGYEVLRQIRESHTALSIPIIMITGNEDENSRVKALALGANDFLMKPYNADILRHCLLNNITMRENATLARAAQFDDLTGLYNRRGFFAKAAELIAEHEPGYYVMASFDVDNFKVVNDQYGTGKGDEVLRDIAETFRTGFEPEGGICCRISADNFAVLYPKSFMDSRKLEQIRHAASAPRSAVMPISFSVGRYIIDDLSLPVSSMFDRASLAEESAKGHYNANIAMYRESLRERLLHEQRLVTEMKTALESGQFEVWFQPQYNHASGALVGAEALVRWRRADGELVLPGDFMPVFERNGFIYEVDKFVWQQACALLQKWMGAGQLPLPVSVNISRSDVFHDDFFDTLTGLVERYQIPVELLRLEITETAFVTAAEQIVSIVKRLMAYGFTVEIDDFGSGYSSLNTLKDVPADVLKLDMRFLEDTGNSRRGGNILESVVRMAKWLGMSVIAEGVERREQADYLRSIGCNYVQGYLYSRPMPEQEYTALSEGHDKEREMIALQTVETLDNSAFWDPESMDTLIFNSYVGGACIFEYYNGRVELLRVNNKYLEVLGQTVSEGNAETVDPLTYMDEAGRESFCANIRHAMDTRRECACETVLSGLPGLDGSRFIRFTVRVIARAGERYLLYCSVIDMTEQRLSEQAVIETARELEQMMQDMPGGYMRIRLVPGGGGRLVYLNDKLCAMLGQSRREIEELYAAGPLAGVHPDDLLIAGEALERMKKNGEARGYRYRLRSESGFLWVSVFGRVTKNQAEETFLNLYYADATEQIRGEEREKELLDNLPCGVGEYEFRDGQMSLTYQNKSFWQLVGLEEASFPDPAPMSAIHPEDTPAVMQEFSAAIREQRDISCDIRLRHLSLGYRPAHLAGRIVRAKAGGVLIYATFSLISGEGRLSFAPSARQMMQDMPGGYARMRITETGLVPVLLNNEFCRLCSMSYEQVMELYEKDAYAGIHPDDAEHVSAAISGAIENRAPVSLRIRFANGGGGYVSMQVFYRVTEDDSGLYLNGYYTDATEMNQIEEQRRELLENLPCGAGIYEITGAGIRATYLNRQYRAYLKREIADLRAAPVFEVVHPDDTGKLKETMQKALSMSKEGSCDIRIMDGAGGYIPFHVVGRVIERSRDKTAIYVTYTPVTEKELLLHRQAETDGMTGVYNKATAERMISERMSATRGVPCVLMIADLDELKAVNDSLGHPQGDKAICRIAGALKAQFRKSDIIGRIGGDEFVVFLEGVERRETLESMASKLLQGSNSVMTGEAEDYPVHMSIGIAQTHTGETTFGELYTKADKALYQAKKNGKNQFVVYAPAGE